MGGGASPCVPHERILTGQRCPRPPSSEAADGAPQGQPKARAAANGRIESRNLTAILKLLNIPQSDWVEG